MAVRQHDPTRLLDQIENLSRSHREHELSRFPHLLWIGIGALGAAMLLLPLAAVISMPRSGDEVT